MKKLFLFSMMCLMALTMQAQRCAVLDFQVGTSVTEEDVDGISYIFRVNFRPSGYTLLERDQINRTIKSQNYNRTDMSMQQMLRVGRNLDATIIVIGTMNKFMDEYSVDIRVINVETGTTKVTESATFKKTDYRASMENLAKNLAAKLSSSSTGRNIISTTSEVQGYVNLGLPSGTLWKATNESGVYNYNDAVSKFEGNLPSQEQWLELKDYCTWSWTGTGYKVRGSNGEFIILSASGSRWCHEYKVDGVGKYGDYWSSTLYDNDLNGAWHLYFSSSEIELFGSGDGSQRCHAFSVRLVH